jgi:hypothetical protein
MTTNNPGINDGDTPMTMQEAYDKLFAAGLRDFSLQEEFVHVARNGPEPRKDYLVHYDHVVHHTGLLGGTLEGAVEQALAHHRQKIVLQELAEQQEAKFYASYGVK